MTESNNLAMVLGLIAFATGTVSVVAIAASAPGSILTLKQRAIALTTAVITYIATVILGFVALNHALLDVGPFLLGAIWLAYTVAAVCFIVGIVVETLEQEEDADDNVVDIASKRSA